MYKLIMFFSTILALTVGPFYGSAPVEAQSDQLTDIWVLVTTSNIRSEAGTDDSFMIGLLNNNDEVFKGFHSSAVSKPWDENEAGHTDSFHFTMERNAFYNHRSFFSNSSVCIRIHGPDAWLIQSIFIIGRLRNGNTVLLSQ